MDTVADDLVTRLREAYRPIRARLEPPVRVEVDAFMVALVGLVESAAKTAAKTLRELDALKAQAESHAQGLDQLVEDVGQLLDVVREPEPPPAWIEHLENRPFSLAQRAEVRFALVSALEPEDRGPPPAREPLPEPPTPTEAETFAAIMAILAKQPQGHAA
jgi:hypothetical protein